MPRDITVTLQDGSTHVYKGAPDDITPDAVTARASKDFGKGVSHLDGGKQQGAPRWDVLGDIGRAAEGSASAVGQDLHAAFPDPATEDFGPVATVKRMGHALKVPLDAAGVALSPVTGAIHGILGSALSYAMPTGVKDVDGPLGTHFYSDPKKAADQVIDQSMLGLGPRGMASGPEGLAASGIANAELATARTAAKSTNKAVAKVNQRMADDGITPQQVLDAQRSANAGGDKVTLMDLGDKNVRGLAGAVHRAPGEAGKQIDTFLEGRDQAASGALTSDVQSSVAKGSTYNTTQDLLKARSDSAGPLYKTAFEADSTAPFEHQYRRALMSATGTKGKIAKQIAAIERDSSGALASRGAAGADVRAKYMDLRQQLEQAETDRTSAMEVFQKAKADKTADAPGAVWSPRLQQFLDNPEVQSGLRQALKLEKQDAITERRPFKDSDYGIVGADNNGDPVLGTVPTMKSLAVAKEGLDARIAEMKDPVTGRPTKAGLSLKRFRDQFLTELDTLNPRYKAARDAWSGPSQSTEAIREGKQHFSRTESNEQIKAEFDSLSPGDKDLYRMGAAEAKVDALERAPDASDKSKRVINTERDRKRFRILFGSDAEADQFINSVARKRTAFETKQAVKGGSQTAGRQIEDADHAPLGLHAAHGASQVAGGNWIGAAKTFYNLKKDLGLRNNPQMNSEIARLLLEHNFPAGSGDSLLSPVPVPRGNTAAAAALANELMAGSSSSRQRPKH